MLSALSRPAAWIIVATLLATAAAAQDRGPPRPGPGGPPTIPDHWMTLDSLARAVGLGVGHEDRIAESYNALNAVMRDAAQRRRAMREELQGVLGGRTPQDLSDAERAGLRARSDSARAELEALQAELDLWHGAIRNALTPLQQEKFDALPRPSVVGPRMRRAPARS